MRVLLLLLLLLNPAQSIWKTVADTAKVTISD